MPKIFTYIYILGICLTVSLIYQVVAMLVFGQIASPLLLLIIGVNMYITLYHNPIYADLKDKWKNDWQDRRKK